MGNATVSKQSLRGATVFRVYGSPHYLIKKDGKTFTGKAGRYYQLEDADSRQNGTKSQTTYVRPGHNNQSVVTGIGYRKLQCAGRARSRSRHLTQLPNSEAAAVISAAKRFVSLPVYDVPKAVFSTPSGKYVLLTKSFYQGDPRLFIGTPGKMRELAIKSVIRARDGGTLIIKTKIGEFFLTGGFNREKESTYTTSAGVKSVIPRLRLSAKGLALAVRRQGVKLRKKTPDPRSVKLFCD